MTPNFKSMVSGPIALLLFTASSFGFSSSELIFPNGYMASFTQFIFDESFEKACDGFDYDSPATPERSDFDTIEFLLREAEISEDDSLFHSPFCLHEQSEDCSCGEDEGKGINNSKEESPRYTSSETTAVFIIDRTQAHDEADSYEGSRKPLAISANSLLPDPDNPALRRELYQRTRAQSAPDCRKAKTVKSGSFLKRLFNSKGKDKK